MFTQDIPISDGPYKFHGLPDLIVKLEDQKKHYVFTLLSVEPQLKPRPINISSPRRIINTTREKFITLEENYRHSFIIHTQDAKLAPESQRIASENIRNRNNPIE